MTKVIILASSNKGKIKEINKIFSDYKVLTLKEAEEKLNKKLDVYETQDTFVGNALQKTRELFELVGTDYICIGDDSGISIDVLNGFPGVKTARWMDASDHIKNLEILHKMEGANNRACHYTTVIAIVSKNFEKTFEYTLDGNISKNARGINGFGFDEIFEINGNITLAEMTSNDKLLISPRTKALEKVKKFIENNKVI